MNVPIAAVTLLAVVLGLRTDWAGARGERFDIGGTVIYSLTLVALMCGLVLITDGLGQVLLLCGLVGLALFVFWESREGSPLISIGLFRHNKLFAFSNLTLLLSSSSTYAVTFLLSLYLQYAKGLPPQTAGVILVCQPLINALVAPFAGRLSDRIEPRKVVAAGMCFTLVALTLLSFTDHETAIWFIVLCLVVIGSGVSLFASPNANALMGAVEKKEFGVAAATMNTMRMIGQTLSMAIAMLIFSLVIGRVQITEEYLPQFLMAFRIAMFTGMALCFTGIFTSLARGNLQAVRERSIAESG